VSTPPPKKKPRAIPRLAEIKIHGVGPRSRTEKTQTAGSTLAGLVLFGGAAVAGAAWIGGALFDVREAFYASADSVASGFGLEATLDVEGAVGARRDEVLEQALPPGRTSIMAASPDRIKTKVESLDWVEEARVARLWPSTIRISVKRREAFALWQEGGRTTVIDSAGERVHGAKVENFPALPRVVGKGAGPAAQPILTALEETPAIRGRLEALVRVGGRRWDLHLKNRVVVALPEQNPAGALAYAERLERGRGMLDGRYGALDLRSPGKIFVSERPAETALEGA
jgi:cell division protein FtsQ